jgi:hypothetical protein
VRNQMTDSASVEPASGFCEVLRVGSEDIWRATLRHPFMAEPWPV